MGVARLVGDRLAAAFGSRRRGARRAADRRRRFPAAAVAPGAIPAIVAFAGLGLGLASVYPLIDARGRRAARRPAGRGDRRGHDARLRRLPAGPPLVGLLRTPTSLRVSLAVVGGLCLLAAWPKRSESGHTVGALLRIVLSPFWPDLPDPRGAGGCAGAGVPRAAGAPRRRRPRPSRSSRGLENFARAAGGVRVPADMAYVSELVRRGVWEYDVGYIPVTPAREHVSGLRDSFLLGRAGGALPAPPAGRRGGVSVEDDWPRGPYLLAAPHQPTSPAPRRAQTARKLPGQPARGAGPLQRHVAGKLGDRLWR